MRSLGPIVLALTSLILLSAQTRPAPAVATRPVETTTKPVTTKELGPFTLDPRFSQASLDGKHVATIVRAKPGHEYIVIDGKNSVEFHSVRTPVFSPDSKHFAFVATKTNGREVVVIDGREFEYDSVSRLRPNPLTFIQNRAVYIAGLNGVSSLYADGQKIRDFANLYEITVSPDLHHFGATGAGNNGSATYVDNQPVLQTDSHANAYLPLFSPDSKHVAFAAQPGGREDKVYIVLDGKGLKEYTALYDTTLAFSPDSKHLAYLAKSDTRSVVVVDDKECPSDITFFPLVFSPNSKRVAIASTGCLRIVEDGKQVAVYIGGCLGEAVFSADSKHTAVAINKEFRSGSPECVMIDGKPGPEFEAILAMGAAHCTITPDNAVEYLAVKDKKLYKIHVPLEP